VSDRRAARIRNSAENRATAHQPKYERFAQRLRSHPDGGLDVVCFRDVDDIIAIDKVNRLKPAIAVTFEIGDEFGNALLGDPKLGRNYSMSGMILYDGGAQCRAPTRPAATQAEGRKLKQQRKSHTAWNLRREQRVRI
jgi:hypothetical protein